MACGLMGLSVAGAYGRRPKQLRSMRSALRMLETEISYAVTLLPDALARSGARVGGPVGEFFAAVSASLETDDFPGAGEAWGSGLDMFADEMALAGEDVDILRRFGSSLGISDREEQLKNLHLTQEHLKHQEAIAERERLQNERMWRTVGFLAGLAIVVILF